MLLNVSILEKQNHFKITNTISGRNTHFGKERERERSNHTKFLARLKGATPALAALLFQSGPSEMVRRGMLSCEFHADFAVTVGERLHSSG